MEIRPTIVLALQSLTLSKIVASNLAGRECDTLLANTTKDVESLLDELLPKVLVIEAGMLDSLGELTKGRLKEAAENAEVSVLAVGLPDEGRAISTFPFLKLLQKPVSPERMIQGVLRALEVSGGSLNNTVAIDAIGPLRVDSVKQMVFFQRSDGAADIIDLCPAEFKLLQFLVRHPDQVFYRSEIVRGIWGRETVQEDRTIDVYVRRLRQALEPFGLDSTIKTIRGVGYTFLTSSFQRSSEKMKSAYGAMPGA